MEVALRLGPLAVWARARSLMDCRNVADAAVMNGWERPSHPRRVPVVRRGNDWQIAASTKLRTGDNVQHQALLWAGLPLEYLSLEWAIGDQLRGSSGRHGDASRRIALRVVLVANGH